eukprot:CAMPEP_0118945946 /NCGR_PEP_ID=MMETSP1169-20130426/43306_1 /TAXON_ID=36882 /ORGANISM="Pyramimonas obovata, Strain CCMP722" /LENGTH=111 /DNA_ID=CAMNT_0006891793 /DNA_START=10 /DNA_END=342 /DNA_ORIENTATION=-
MEMESSAEIAKESMEEDPPVVVAEVQENEIAEDDIAEDEVGEYEDYEDVVVSPRPNIAANFIKARNALRQCIAHGDVFEEASPEDSTDEQAVAGEGIVEAKDELEETVVGE